MTLPELREAFEFYKRFLTDSVRAVPVELDEDMQARKIVPLRHIVNHLLWVVDTCLEVLVDPEQSNVSTLQRCLGYVRGELRCLGYFSVNELRAHIQPSVEEATSEQDSGSPAGNPGSPQADR
jgi:hypothetical protein